MAMGFIGRRSRSHGVAATARIHGEPTPRALCPGRPSYPRCSCCPSRRPRAISIWRRRFRSCLAPGLVGTRSDRKKRPMGSVGGARDRRIAACSQCSRLPRRWASLAQIRGIARDRTGVSRPYRSSAFWPRPDSRYPRGVVRGWVTYCAGWRRCCSPTARCSWVRASQIYRRVDGWQDLAAIGAALRRDADRRPLILFGPDETTRAFVDMYAPPCGRNHPHTPYPTVR